MPLEPDRGRGPGFALALVMIVAIGVGLVLLVWQNQEPVPLRFLGFEAQVPLFVIVLVTALVALILDEVVGLVWRRRRARRLRDREELDRLRQAGTPIVDDGFESE